METNENAGFTNETEVNREDIKSVQDTKEPEPVQNNTGNQIEDIVNEEVDQNGAADENTTINDEDFTVDREDIETEKAEEKKDPENKKDPKTENKSTESEAKEEPEHVNTKKEGALKRQMKPKLMLTFANVILGRVGGLFNSQQPPSYWQFSKADKGDIEILLGETVEEENLSGMGAKWMLLIVIGIILIVKIMNRNKEWKPDASIDYKTETNVQAKTIEYEKIYTEARARYDGKNNFDKVQNQIDQLVEQNKLLRKIIDEKILKNSETDFELIKDIKTSIKTPSKGRFYKNFDLEKISFSKAGAMINPDKAGDKGYSTKGAKMGIPSEEDRDIQKAWEAYHEEKELQNG